MSRALAGFIGGGISGYITGQKMKTEEEERLSRKEEREARKAEREKKARDDEAIRAALAGDRNAPMMTNSATDLADVTASNAQPRSAQVEAIQRVGTNVFSDPDAAARAAEMANFESGADEGQGAKVEPTAAYRVPGRGVYADPAEAISAAQQAGEDGRLAAVRSEGVDKPVQRGLDKTAADAYFKRKSPAVIDAYLRQGKVAEAKAYRDFIDSEAGRNYAEQWSRGVRKLSIGDHQSALNDWQDLYNQQLYNDGHTVKLTPTEDGKQVRADFFDQAGKQVRTFTQPLDALARQAGMALAPEKLVEMRAQQDAKRETEAATLDRQTQLEELRQQGREVSEDRRDERLGMRIDQQSQQFERRLQAERERRDNPKPLTPAQQRTNDSIVAARQQLAGMSQADILRKTQSSLSSGRTNPDFDPGLARAAKIATSRMFGEDPAHDQFSGAKGNENAAANARADVAKRFRADPTMNLRTMGRETPDGIEVLEKGRVVGHYR